MMRLAFATALVLSAAPVLAQSVSDCDGWQANARNVNWSDPTRTFANGAIRLVALDTVEPAAAAFHIMVIYPDPEQLFLDCRMVSLAPDTGFGGISLTGAGATYDPARGLTITVPGSTIDATPLDITFTVNRATGDVTVP